ncbi:hypothetical protein BHM03_00022940 [Ensete ventricosum]|nr:hypothetical protein BHM03_00022940 [Ensete ventricosum]
MTVWIIPVNAGPTAQVRGRLPRRRPTAPFPHQGNVFVLFVEAEVSSWLGPTRVCRSVNVVLTVEPKLGVRSEGCLP